MAVRSLYLGVATHLKGVAIQDLGPDPTRQDDVVDINWVQTAYPFFSTTVTTGDDLALEFPEDPANHTMLLVEVIATSQIEVTLPLGTLLTIGAQPVTVVPLGKVAFFGFRYSATVGHWFLLSTTTQV